MRISEIVALRTPACEGPSTHCFARTKCDVGALRQSERNTMATHVGLKLISGLQDLKGCERPLPGFL